MSTSNKIMTHDGQDTIKVWHVTVKVNNFNFGVGDRNKEIE